MHVSKDLMAASATPLVLSLLQHNDSYGYELISKVRTLSDGQLEWKEGMLYPLLHRLEKNGLIESYTEALANGRRRKYYRLLPKGRESLVEQRSTFKQVAEFLDLAAHPTPGVNHA